MGISKTRVATSANLKSKKNAAMMRAINAKDSANSNSSVGGIGVGNIPSNILLARGLSARYCGSNVPLMGLTNDEVERDLRHMEAFSNACIAYAQQYYIYQNSATVASAQTAASTDDENAKNGNKKHSTNAATAGVGSGGGVTGTGGSGATGGSGSGSGAGLPQQHPPAPIIAMPVRIDPEEEKRLANLRLKIQQCEAQREVLESQYLSLRAHYVYMSQRLKNSRKAVTGRVDFLQHLLRKRGKLVALQRVRLQISREVLACLHYRQSGGKVVPNDDDNNNNNKNNYKGTEGDLLEVWNKIEEQFKQAEESCRATNTTTTVGGGGGSSSSSIEHWSALKVPKIPPGIPLLLSQLAKPPGFAAAWSTAGMFGSNKESMCWLEPDFPEPAHRTKSLSALREEVDLLKRELDKERKANRDLQTDIITRRKANIELVAMMALLRTETEAVVARHNILLESDVAKEATFHLQHLQHDYDDDDDDNNEESAAGGATARPAVPGGEKDEDAKGLVIRSKPAVDVANASTSTRTVPDPKRLQHTTAAAVKTKTKSTTQAADDENDGDDEGEAGDDEDEDEGEILERGGTGAAAEKRSHDAGSSDGSSPRSKRRKV